MDNNGSSSVHWQFGWSLHSKCPKDGVERGARFDPEYGYRWGGKDNMPRGVLKWREHCFLLTTGFGPMGKPRLLNEAYGIWLYVSPPCMCLPQDRSYTSAVKACIHTVWHGLVDGGGGCLLLLRCGPGGNPRAPDSTPAAEVPPIPRGYRSGGNTGQSRTYTELLTIARVQLPAGWHPIKHCGTHSFGIELSLPIRYLQLILGRPLVQKSNWISQRYFAGTPFVIPPNYVR